MVDGSSTVNTDTFGTAPNRVFVVEWRDVAPLGQPNLRMSFEVQLGESGSIVTSYQNVEPDPFQRGASASIGIEDETGTNGIQFSFGQPVLSNNLTVAYTLPPSGFVRGTITDANDGTPVAGATVRALQGGAVMRQVNADGTGAYVMHLPVGAYTIEATATNYSVESKSVNVTLNANLQANFALKTGRAVAHAVDHSIDGAGQPDADAPADAREHRLGEPVVHDQRIGRRAPVHGVDRASGEEPDPEPERDEHAGAVRAGNPRERDGAAGGGRRDQVVPADRGGIRLGRWVHIQPVAQRRQRAVP